jgi:hypothetical protein
MRMHGKKKDCSNGVRAVAEDRDFTYNSVSYVLRPKKELSSEDIIQTITAR